MTHNPLKAAIDSITDEQRQVLSEAYGIEPKTDESPVNDMEDMRKQWLDANVPKVYMLREQYEKLDPDTIREAEREHCCIHSSFRLPLVLSPPR